MGLTSDEQKALIWPIKAKGAVNRLNPLNDPAISQFYPKSMEQGRILENSIADANNFLLEKKIQLTQLIQNYTHMNSLAVDGQLGHHARVPKYIADSISILKTAQQLQQEIVGLVAALEQNIQTILTIEASMLAMVQANLNAIANLLNNICNWGIPALPSLPNLIPDQIWNWNGFQFSPLALFAQLKSNTNFNFNFSFSECSLGITTPSSTFVGDPLTLTNYSGLTFGAQVYNPPFGNAQSVTPANQNLNDPIFIANMQATTAIPVYSPTFNPNTQMFGAVPDPHQVISDWQMSATVYTNNIVSITPQLRSNTVFTTDADYANPNYAVRNPQLRKDLVHFITLADIIASNYDPFVVSAWLIYLSIARAGRGGVWIPNFQTVYNTYLQPSISTLFVQPVPWNNVLPSQANYEWMGSWSSTVTYVVGDVVVFNGVDYIAQVNVGVTNVGLEPDQNPDSWVTPLPSNIIYSDAPVIAFSSTLQALPQNQLAHLLWQLSYIEAGILGYTRNRTWDTNQDTSYLTGPTGSSLDYQPTQITAAQSSLILGQGTAQFPVPITFPTAMKSTLDQVIALAAINIQNDIGYISPRLGNRYTYNQFAVATQVDRFSQFWRDFSTNLTSFLAQDPYLVQFAITYPEILDGAIDPLASASDVAAYQSLLQDVATRNRSWVPGTPLLTIPIQPVTNISNTTPPTTPSNGWVNNMELNPAAFLARPDIQTLPIPVQIAMLRTNLSYAGVNTWSNNMQNEIASLLTTTNALLQSVTTPGFNVSDYATTTPVSTVQFGAITNVSVTSNTVTVIMNTMPTPFVATNSVILYGLSGATFLNGVPLTVLTASPTSFTATFTTPDYPSALDTGVAFINPFISLVTDVAFDPLVPPQDYDYTGNYTNATTFTIQTTGNYFGFAVINWNLTVTDTVGIMVTQNGTPVGVSVQSASSGPLSVSVSFNGEFSQGDIVHVSAFTLTAAEDVVPDPSSQFSMFAVPA
jgi:hypothetical protein